jgi:hypothetical protein
VRWEENGRKEDWMLLLSLGPTWSLSAEPENLQINIAFATSHRYGHGVKVERGHPQSLDVFPRLDKSHAEQVINITAQLVFAIQKLYIKPFASFVKGPFSCPSYILRNISLPGGADIY